MIDITENAIKRIKDISLKQESNLFRISVDGGGCQGFSYKFSFDKIKGNDDHEINFVHILRFQILMLLPRAVVEPHFQFNNDNNCIMECKLYKSKV